MLIATAGHVDHGKTSLVRCLTGVDTDRLPEEKARGLTIAAGFAYHDLSDGTRIGFVDVPGHEKFVRNMLAGVAAVDAAMLLVAADDGPMPQTLEHLEILNLLGLARGVIVISKIDRVDEARLAEVRDQVQRLVAGTFLEGATVLPVSTVNGAGVDAVRSYLQALSRQVPATVPVGRFRLAIDRVFTISGVGTVVTGAVFSGAVRVGDDLNLLPVGQQVRVRSLHVQDRPASNGIGSVGERCAIGLGGAALTRLKPARGDWLVGAPQPRISMRVDIRLTNLSSHARDLVHWTPVHIHHGAAALTGRVAVLKGRAIAPGATEFAQLVLDQPMIAARGDRLILRDQSARRTLAGGVVFDPFGAGKGRSRAERIDILETMSLAQPDAVLRARLAIESGGVDLVSLTQAMNLNETETIRLLDSVAMEQIVVRGIVRAVDSDRWQTLTARLMATIQTHHKACPDRAGPRADELYGKLTDLATSPLIDACLNSLVRSRCLMRRGAWLMMPAHEPAVTSADQSMWLTIKDCFGPRQIQPAPVGDIARQLAIEAPELEAFLRRMATHGRLIRVTERRYFHPDALIRLAQTAEQLVGAIGPDYHPGDFDAGQFRDATGIGRNVSIDVLEYFDAHRFTRRVGDRRRLLCRANEVFGLTPTEESLPP